MTRRSYRQRGAATRPSPRGRPSPPLDELPQPPPLRADGYPSSKVDAVPFTTPEGEEEYHLSPLGVLQFFWNLDDADINDMGGEVQKDVRVFRTRVKAAYDAACLAHGKAPSIDDILRKVGRPELLHEAIRKGSLKGPYGKGDVLKRMLLGEGVN